jgi:hypothetical protein
MRVRVSAQMGVMTETPDSPLLRKPQWEHEWNNQVSSFRASVERAVATLKTWRILFTDYRRPLKTFKSSFHACNRTLLFQGEFRITLLVSIHRVDLDDCFPAGGPVKLILGTDDGRGLVAAHRSAACP